MVEINATIAPGIKSQRTHVDGVPIKGLRDKTPTLIQNQSNQYTFAPRYLADELVAAHKAVVIDASYGEEYTRGVRLALGLQDGVSAAEFCQINGKFVHSSEIGKLDVAAILKAAEEGVKKYEADKKSGLIPKAEMPAGPETFTGKKRQSRWA